MDGGMKWEEDHFQIIQTIAFPGNLTEWEKNEGGKKLLAKTNTSNCLRSRLIDPFN